MIIKFRYLPIPAKAAAIVCLLGVCVLIYLVFFVRPAADRDPEINMALAIVDTDAPAALRVLEHYTPRDSDNAVRAAALNSFARFLAGHDDTTRALLDTTAIVALRHLGRNDNPLLARGLIAYGVMAANRGEYQTAINALGESADRALNQLSDTLLAARAYRFLGNVFNEISAYQSGIQYLSTARDLFSALKQQGRADLCRTTIITMLARSFDEANIMESVAMLDSIKPRVETNSQYSEYLNYSKINIQPRLRAGLFDQAIFHGKKTLSESYCRPIDSLWAYALMAKAAIGSHRFNEAHQWLDSARQFQDLISRKLRGTRVSLTGIELDLIDSLATDPHIKALRKTYDAENDSLFALYKSNIALMRPSYSLEAYNRSSGAERQATIIAILILIALSGGICFIFFSRISDLQVRIAKLQNNYNSISRYASSLAEKIGAAEAEAETLNSELQETRSHNDSISRQLHEYMLKLTDSQELIQNLSQKLRETEQTALDEKAGLTERIKSLTRKLHNISAANSSAQRKKESVVPYISAIDTMIRSSFPEPQQNNISPSNKKIEKLLAYLRSYNFTESLSESITAIEPLFVSYNPEIQSLLSRQQYLIFLMSICGFSVPSIAVVSGVSRTSLYRRREDIENILLDTGDNHLQSLVEKYIRHYK